MRFDSSSITTAVRLRHIHKAHIDIQVIVEIREMVFLQFFCNYGKLSISAMASLGVNPYQEHTAKKDRVNVAP